jgi:uncharacterized DUF497 family protein
MPGYIEATGFEWDRGNRAKCRKHGVSIAEIEALFARQIAIFPAPAHSHREERFKAIGTTESGKACLSHLYLAPARY